MLVRNPHKDQTEPAKLHYAQVPEYSTLRQKFDWLESLGDVTSDAFETVEVNDTHDWVNITDGTYGDMLSVCAISGEREKGDTAVQDHALGLATNCDTYVYSFSRGDLINKMKCLIDAYEDARELHHDLGLSLDECTANTELTVIKWTGTLKQSLKKGENLAFDETRIREVLYRPFTKLWLYEDHRILSSVKTVSAMFPVDDDEEIMLGEVRPSVRPTDRPTDRPSSSPLPTTEPSSGPSPPTASWTSAQSEQTNQLDSSHGGDPHNARPTDAVCDPRHNDHNGSARSRPSNSRAPAQDTATPIEAVLVSSPSNRTVFAALATDSLPDLHALDPAGRVMTRTGTA